MNMAFIPQSVVHRATNERGIREDRDLWRRRAALTMVLAAILAAGHLISLVAWALEELP